jgi:hypothetical protein
MQFQHSGPFGYAGNLWAVHLMVRTFFRLGNCAPPRELAEFLMARDGKYDVNLTDQSEVYTVRDSVWKAAGLEPYGGCLCVGCLEKRIGRKLKPKDFTDHTFNNLRMPCTDRLRDRRGRG